MPSTSQVPIETWAKALFVSILTQRWTRPKYPCSSTFSQMLRALPVSLWTPYSSNHTSLKLSCYACKNTARVLVDTNKIFLWAWRFSMQSRTIRAMDVCVKLHPAINTTETLPQFHPLSDNSGTSCVTLHPYSLFRNLLALACCGLLRLHAVMLPSSRRRRHTSDFGGSQTKVTSAPIYVDFYPALHTNKRHSCFTIFQTILAHTVSLTPSSTALLSHVPYQKLC